ncbi:serine/threonine/tyrosine-interacting-like protein 1 isoform X2 [Montipora capricornis]|uniref:serine/threonine/tyrosine-interacting-like protein 1 isoform X2 n=1 Tax=Montipora capricornis TaxID=246305 RepID=UPI0035F1144A
MSSAGTTLCECTEVYNILNQAGQYPRLSDPNYLLLLDTREIHDYNESHVITAKYAPRNDIGAFTVPHDAELETKEHVVVYDSKTSSLKDKNSTALSCARLMWEMGSRNPIKIIKGGFEKFSAQYPFLRTQKITYMPRNGTCAQLLMNNLWNLIKGILFNSELANIAHVSFSPDSMTLGRGDKRVKQVFIVPIEDNGDEDLYSHLTDIVGFIDDHQTQDGCTVLLSSILGISRSVTVAIAYYMWSKKLSLKDSYNHVKKCRKNMQPTRGFIEQLSRWEEKLFGSIVTDITEPNY